MVRVSEANEPSECVSEAGTEAREPSECVSEARTTEPHTVQLNVTGPGQREEGQQGGRRAKETGQGLHLGRGLKCLLQRHEHQRSEPPKPLGMSGEYGCPATTPASGGRDKYPRARWSERPAIAASFGFPGETGVHESGGG